MSGNQNDEPWLPKTRDDWVSMFADGQALHKSREAEEAAKTAAAQGDQSKDSKDEGEKKPRTLAERILGVVT
jgi:hypothetical protein